MKKLVFLTVALAALAMGSTAVFARCHGGYNYNYAPNRCQTGYCADNNANGYCDNCGYAYYNYNYNNYYNNGCRNHCR